MLKQTAASSVAKNASAGGEFATSVYAPAQGRRTTMNAGISRDRWALESRHGVRASRVYTSPDQPWTAFSGVREDREWTPIEPSSANATVESTIPDRYPRRPSDASSRRAG